MRPESNLPQRYCSSYSETFCLLWRGVVFQLSAAAERKTRAGVNHSAVTLLKA